LGPAISEILPLAVGIMISPIAIVAVILMLFSPRARANGPSFLIGWIVGLSIVTVVVYLIADSADVASDSSASDTTSTTKVVLGVVLMFLALRQWRGRPAPGETSPPPKWMGAIDSVTPVKAVGLGVLLSAVNPKNLILAVGAAAAIAQTGPSTGDAVVAIIVFVLIASLGIIVPVAAYLFAGERARTMLDGWKSWLEEHNAAVMTVVLLLIGVVLIGKGLGLLTA